MRRSPGKHFNISKSLSVCVFQGCITLQGCQVNELTANPDEPGRHLFEIVPGEIHYPLLSSPTICTHCPRLNTCLCQHTLKCGTDLIHGLSLATAYI